MTAGSGTIAVDFDGVIHAYSKGWLDGSLYDDPVPGAIESLNVLMVEYSVYVHTTRRPGDVGSWLKPYGFDVTTDDTCPSCRGTSGISCPICLSSGMLLFWNERGKLLVTPRKLPALVYVDDRGLRFTGSWDRALSDLVDLAARGWPAS